jgi:hypothetical protein
MSDSALLEWLKFAVVILFVIILILVADAGVAYWKTYRRGRNTFQQIRERELESAKLARPFTLPAKKGFSTTDGDRRATVRELKRKIQ